MSVQAAQPLDGLETLAGVHNVVLDETSRPLRRGYL